jgi:hypothetical protein
VDPGVGNVFPVRESSSRLFWDGEQSRYIRFYSPIVVAASALPSAYLTVPIDDVRPTGIRTSVKWTLVY